MRYLEIDKGGRAEMITRPDDIGGKDHQPLPPSAGTGGIFCQKFERKVITLNTDQSANNKILLNGKILFPCDLGPGPGPGLLPVFKAWVGPGLRRGSRPGRFRLP